MGFIYFDSLSSPQLKGEKQSITGMEKVSRHHPIYFPTLLLLVSSTGLEIYRLFFFFFFTAFEDLHPISIWSFFIGIFWVPILLKAK